MSAISLENYYLRFFPDITRFHDSRTDKVFDSLNAKLNPICLLLALLGAHHILHVSRTRVKVKFTGKEKKLLLELFMVYLTTPSIAQAAERRMADDH